MSTQEPALYRAVFDNVLTKMSAERAHHMTVATLKALQSAPGGLQAARARYGMSDTGLATSVFGRRFANPVGLAAGFDKDAQVIDAMAAFGFGFVEVGTVTGQPQPGNPKPRLFRLPQDRAIVNRMGFNNAGAQAVARRLHQRAQKGTADVVLGINIGKTKVVPVADAITDYVASTSLLAPYADYLVVNVSSPNTPGLRDLQAISSLRPLLAAVLDAAVDRDGTAIPVVVKIAPDLADDDVVEVASLVPQLGLAGVVATNTTIARSGLASSAEQVEACGAGGLSGPVLKERSLAVLRLLRQHLPAEAVVISVGGISTPVDAWERLCAGANLIQGYTGLIYGGPSWAWQMHRGLSDLMQECGYSDLSEVVGSKM